MVLDSPNLRLSVSIFVKEGVFIQIHICFFYDNPIPVKKETKFLGILVHSKLTSVPLKLALDRVETDDERNVIIISN